MKKIINLTACLFLASLSLVFGQPARINQQPARINPSTGLPIEEVTNLPKFNLDFPGGTPSQLVKAIEKASGKPLNVIINKEDENVQLPPLKMNEVGVPELFSALGAVSASSKQVYVGNNLYSSYYTSYGFKTVGNPTKNSIWYFQVSKPPQSDTTCRFFSLDPYLARGFTVDDITTAIQTGWKMAGITSPPELNYHKETKLLIACGEAHELETIESVLKTLPPSNASTSDTEELRKAIVSLREQINNMHITLIPGQNLPYPDVHAQLGAGAKHEEKSGK